MAASGLGLDSDWIEGWVDFMVVYQYEDQKTNGVRANLDGCCRFNIDCLTCDVAEP